VASRRSQQHPQQQQQQQMWSPGKGKGKGGSPPGKGKGKGGGQPSHSPPTPPTPPAPTPPQTKATRPEVTREVNTSASLLKAIDLTVPAARKTQARSLQGKILQQSAWAYPSIGHAHRLRLHRELGIPEGSTNLLSTPSWSEMGVTQGINLWDTTAVLKDLLVVPTPHPPWHSAIPTPHPPMLPTHKARTSAAYMYPPSKVSHDGSTIYWEDYANQGLRLLLAPDSPVDELFLMMDVQEGTTGFNFAFLNATIAWPHLRPSIHRISLHEGVKISNRPNSGHICCFHLRKPEDVRDTWPAITSQDLDDDEPGEVADPMLGELVSRSLATHSLMVHAQNLWETKAEAFQVDEEYTNTPLTEIQAGKGMIEKLTFEDQKKMELFLQGDKAYLSWSLGQDNPTAEGYQAEIEASERFLFRVSDMETGFCYLIKPPPDHTYKFGASPHALKTALTKMGIYIRGAIPATLGQVMISTSGPIMTTHLTTLTAKGFTTWDLAGREQGDIILAKFQRKRAVPRREGHHIRVHDLPLGLPQPTIVQILTKWLGVRVASLIIDKGGTMASVYVPSHPAHYVSRRLKVPGYATISWEGEREEKPPEMEVDTDEPYVEDDDLCNKVWRLRAEGLTPVNPMETFKTKATTASNWPTVAMELPKPSETQISSSQATGKIQKLLSKVLKEVKLDLADKSKLAVNGNNRKAVCYGRKLNFADGPVKVTNTIEAVPEGIAELLELEGRTLGDTAILVNQGSVGTLHTDAEALLGPEGTSGLILEGEGQIHFVDKGDANRCLSLRSDQGHHYHVPQSVGRSSMHKTTSSKNNRISIILFSVVKSSPQPSQELVDQAQPLDGTPSRGKQRPRAENTGLSPDGKAMVR
jgi:hypothetical protein